MNAKSRTFTAILAAIVSVGMAGCEPHPREVSEQQSITSMDLDIQNFNNTAKNLTNQMLMAPRVQQAIAADQQQNGGKLPLIKISRIQNDTELKINMVTYLVTPIEEVFTNNGKVDFISEDQTAQDVAAAQNALGTGSAPRLPDFTLSGNVSQLNTGAHGTEQNTYVFHIQLTDTVTGSVVFIGDAQVLKQQNR